MPDFVPRSPISQEPLSVVLLSRNAKEEEAEVVASWAGVLEGLSRPHELILVREGIAPADGADVSFPPACTTGLYSGATGFGAGLRAGIGVAHYPLLFYTVCDKQFQPNDYQRLLEAIDQVDVVTGYRVAGPVPGWFGLLDLLRRWAMRILFGMDVPRRESWLGWGGWKRRWIARWLFGVAVQDPECAFRLFRRELFRRIPIQSNGALAHIEILAKANFLGALIAEMPVAWLAPGAIVLSVRRKGEVFKLFTKPDFGPAVLDAGTPAPTV